MRVRKGVEGVGQAGMGVLGIILWTGFLVLVLFVLHLQVANLASLGGGLESQLYSFVLAENGLELARSVMQTLDADQIIAGQDRNLTASPAAGWRNPLSLNAARTRDRTRPWVPSSDDGLPWDPLSGVQCSHLTVEEGEVFVRFSNNPEEPRDQDRDGILIARSMGVARSLHPSPAGLLPPLRNHATLLEARIRHSRYFESPAPVMLWASRLLNRGGTVSSDEELLAGWVGSEAEAGSELEILRKELGERSPHPEAVQDVSRHYAGDPHRRLMFDVGFWDSLLEQIRNFVDDRNASQLQVLPVGGSLETPGEGLIIAAGALSLRPGFRFRGLILHLGERDLVLESGAEVSGAVWKIAPRGRDRAGRLILNAGSRILFNPDEVARAQRLLPADLLEFRILFPEMKQ